MLNRGRLSVGRHVRGSPAGRFQFVSENILVSTEPATGAELWRGKIGDVDATVDRARRAWPAWAAQPLANRIELVRRFANEVRKESDKLADADRARDRQAACGKRGPRSRR